MSTRKIIAAAASVAIVASTMAMFQASSKVRPGTIGTSSTIGNTTTMPGDPRPVKLLEPVTVYATPLPHVTVSPLEVDSGAPHTGLALPALNTGSQLSMPYYSFASNLQTIIKE